MSAQKYAQVSPLGPPPMTATVRAVSTLRGAGGTGVGGRLVDRVLLDAADVHGRIDEQAAAALLARVLAHKRARRGKRVVPCAPCSPRRRSRPRPRARCRRARSRARGTGFRRGPTGPRPRGTRRAGGGFRTRRKTRPCPQAAPRPPRSRWRSRRCRAPSRQGRAGARRRPRKPRRPPPVRAAPQAGAARRGTERTCRRSCGRTVAQKRQLGHKRAHAPEGWLPPAVHALFSCRAMRASSFDFGAIESAATFVPHVRCGASLKCSCGDAPK